jgi:haloalkane dehalogenase
VTWYPHSKRHHEMEALDIPAKLNKFGEKAIPISMAVLAEDFRSHLKHRSLHLLSAGHWLQIDVPLQIAPIVLGHA